MTVQIIIKPYSPNIELRRLLFTLAQIKRRQYQQGNFLLLTTSPPEGISSVLLPDNLIKHLCRHFNLKIFKTNIWYTSYLTANITPHKSLTSFLQKKVTLNLDQTKLTQAITIIANLLGISHLQLTIYPTSIGTAVSFRPMEKGQIILFVRQDATNLNIIRGIIGSLLRYTNPSINWPLYQQLQHFLATQTSIATLLHIKPPSTSPKIPPQLIIASHQNYALLGFPSTPALTLNGKTVLLHQQPITFLSPSEYQLLFLLLKHPRDTIDYDQIAHILWPNSPNKFSLQAISKIVERIRHQLHLAGLNQPLIFTKPKLGYQLIQ